MKKSNYRQQQKLNQKQLSIIQTICQLSLKDYVQSIDVSQITFPIFKTTYTLWRKMALKQIISKINIQNNTQRKNQIYLNFNRISEFQILPIFISKIQKNIWCVSQQFYKILKESQLATSQGQTQDDYNTKLQYATLIWKQQLYIEIIQDLAKLPYMTIFSSNSHLHVKNQFLTIFSKKKISTISDKIKQKVSSTVINKAWDAFINQFIKNKALFHINTVVGGLNPLAMALTYGFSYSVSSIKKYSNYKQMMAQLKQSIEQTKKKIQKLQQSYLTINQMIKNYLYALAISNENDQEKDKSNKKSINKNKKIKQQQNQHQQLQKQLQSKIKKAFFQIFDQEWLDIEIKHEGQWQIVKIQQKENFQTLNFDYIENE